MNEWISARARNSGNQTPFVYAINKLALLSNIEFVTGKYDKVFFAAKGVRVWGLNDIPVISIRGDSEPCLGLGGCFLPQARTQSRRMSLSHCTRPWHVIFARKMLPSCIWSNARSGIQTPGLVQASAETGSETNETLINSYYAGAKQSALEIRSNFFFLHGSRKLERKLLLATDNCNCSQW